MKIIKSNKTLNSVKGKMGEAKALHYLVDQGYEILETNYKNKIGEIDIIAKYENRLIFVEVKARTTARFGYPREAVNYYKQQKIKNVASVYIKSKHLVDVLTRFDVIEILADEITHLKAAF